MLVLAKKFMVIELSSQTKPHFLLDIYAIDKGTKEKKIIDISNCDKIISTE